MTTEAFRADEGVEREDLQRRAGTHPESSLTAVTAL